MATVDTTEITRVYGELFSSVESKYEAMWAANEIDAETYAKLIGAASSQLIELASSLVQKQEQIDKENEVKQANIMATEAKTRDEYGFEFTTEDEIVRITDVDSKHYHGIDLLKAQVLTENENDELVKARRESTLAEANFTEGRIIQELNGKWDDTLNNGEGSWTFPQVSVTNDNAVTFYSTDDGNKTTNKYLMGVYREYEEGQITKNTATGYKADGAYKAYKSLQELFFALANLGVEPTDSESLAMNGDSDSNPYARIFQSMEKLINIHIDQWYGSDVNYDIKLTKGV